MYKNIFSILALPLFFSAAGSAVEGACYIMYTMYGKPEVISCYDGYTQKMCRDELTRLDWQLRKKYEGIPMSWVSSFKFYEGLTCR